LVFSQLKLHRPYGGVVPELASRAHLERLPLLFSELFTGLEIAPKDVTHVAVTRGPGLVNTLLVGIGFAQGFAYPKRLPLLGVNHLMGHLLSPDLTSPMVFPSLVFLATGGHTALYYLLSPDSIHLIKATVDDAIGEAFDKVAKLLGLPYPGGPSVEEKAREGDENAISLPLPKPENPRALSLSGLKTAVRRVIESQPALSPSFVADLCASFQRTIGRMILSTLTSAIETYPETKAIYFVGGVARNQAIRRILEELERGYGIPVVSPPPEFCTDNAAMIARAGWEGFLRGLCDPWDLQPLSRWEVAPPGA
jgi:N6-L-threonylcarbamoyladenine synthase